MGHTIKNQYCSSWKEGALISAVYFDDGGQNTDPQSMYWSDGQHQKKNTISNEF